jgi:hypothetical protein
MSDADKYVETELGGGGVIVEFVNPPPAPTHKTENINAIEWASLFLPNEPMYIDELEDFINDSSYQVAGSAKSLDDHAIEFDPQSLDTSITYRRILRTCFKRFRDASSGDGVTVNHPLVVTSLTIFEIFGILAAGRKETIMQGVPL